MAQNKHGGRSKRFETMKLANGFVVVCDGGQELDIVGETVTMFGEAGVNVYVKSAPNQDATTDGRLIVDRGVVLLQRSYVSENQTLFSIRMFDREKMDDSLPDVVIPITYIKNNQLSGSILRSSSGKVVKTKIVIETTHSLNTVMTMGPMVITLKMSVVGATTLLSLVNKKLCGVEGDDPKKKEQAINAIVQKLS